MHQGVVWVFNIILETHHPVMKQSLSRHGFAWDMLAKVPSNWDNFLA